MKLLQKTRVDRIAAVLFLLLLFGGSIATYAIPKPAFS